MRNEQDINRTKFNERTEEYEIDPEQIISKILYNNLQISYSVTNSIQFLGATVKLDPIEFLYVQNILLKQKILELKNRCHTSGENK